jgi:hypothetical protein
MKNDEDSYSPEEAEARFEATIRGALKTPPEPRAAAKGKAQSAVVAPKATRQAKKESAKGR